MAEKVINIQDMKPGDIIVFQADEEWISQAIAKLTHSDVSHAALYMGSSTLADEGLSGLACHKMTQDANTRPIYVRRLQHTTDLTPVLNVSKQYVDSNQPYDKPALVLLALILLYKEIPVHKFPSFIITPILIAAASALDTYINSKLHPGKKPMVCSQFVFQCYEDAGGVYKLNLQNGNILKSSPKASLRQNLVQMVSAHVQKGKRLRSGALKLQATRTMDVNDSIAELVRLLDVQETAAAPKGMQALTMDADLVAAVKLFSDKWYRLRNGMQRKSSRKKLRLNAVAYSPALFVTPSDLKSCITNVDATGVSAIYRDDTVAPVPPIA